MNKIDKHQRRKHIQELQNVLMELAEVIDKKISKPLLFAKYGSIFSPLYDEFKAIVNEMPKDYYFTECEDSDMPVINKIVALTEKIKNKIEEINYESSQQIN